MMMRGMIGNVEGELRRGACSPGGLFGGAFGMDQPNPHDSLYRDLAGSI
jgi:hypothetical protein